MVVKKRKPAQTRESTALHEAGHSVIARVLTLTAGGATIKRDYKAGSAGESMVDADPWTHIQEWGNRGKVRGDDAVWHAVLIFFMAGAEAEVEILGHCVGDGADRAAIQLMGVDFCGRDNWDKLERRLRTMTRTLVRRHRARIERVAAALLRKTTLSRREIDRIAGRSIDDVKPNAPFLLAKAMETKRKGRKVNR